MGITILGPNEGLTIPWKESAFFAQRKAAWSDEWQMDPEITLKKAVRHANRGESEAVLTRKYGPKVKYDFETELSAKDPLNIKDHWLRIVILGDGEFPCWTGRIEKQLRNIQGSSAGQQGEQEWAAYGPDRILNKFELFESYWLKSGAAIKLGWHPSFNLRGGSDELTGNRSSSRGPNGAYLFGGTDNWTNYDILEHFVIQHLNSAVDGPTWTIGGQVDLIKNLIDKVKLPDKFNLEHVFSEIISPINGMDYQILDTDDGFEISIYALGSITQSFGPYQMPRNPKRVRIQASSTPDVTCTIEEGGSKTYDKFRIIGHRIRTTFSLEAFNTDWRKMWTDAQEAAYLAGNPAAGSTAKDHDVYRANDIFRDVFQAFAAVAAFDWRGGNALPNMQLDGTLTRSSVPPFQTVERKTLHKLPLREGWDYSVYPPTNKNVSGVEGDFIPPMAFVLYDAVSPSRYCQVDKIGVLDIGTSDGNIHILDNEWGLRLKLQQNHILAKNRWAGAAASNIDPSGGFDYQNCVFTIATETDHRIVLGIDLPTALSSGAGETKVMQEADAHFWVMSPATVIGTAADGTLLRAPGLGQLSEGFIILRDDRDVLARKMAGYIARYLQDRMRASIKIKQMVAWNFLLGQIVETIEDGSDLTGIGAPFTSIFWDFEKRTTTVNTGHATT